MDREQKSSQTEINDAVRRFLIDAITFIVNPKSLDEADLARDLEKSKQLAAGIMEYVSSLGHLDQELLNELKKKQKISHLRSVRN